jgi:ribosomal protein S18 acetylase RimI-like enzyme
LQKPSQASGPEEKKVMEAANQEIIDRLRIREMTIDDLPEVFHLGEEIFTADYSPSMYRTWDEYEITTLFNSDSELCLVAKYEGRLLGFVLGTTVEKTHSAWKYGYLVWLGVRRELRHSGIGEELFHEIKRRMVDQGVRMIIIDTDADNQAGIQFFKKQGFRNIRQHVYMTLNLSRKARRRPGGRAPKAAVLLAPAPRGERDNEP